MCCAAGSVRNALAVRVSGFFTAWASSNTTVVHCTACSVSMSRAATWYVVMTRSCWATTFGERRGAAAAGAVVHGDAQQRREAGGLGLPVAHDRQRADHQVRARAVRTRWASVVGVLPRPMSSARQPPRPSWWRNCSQPSPRR